MEIFNSIFLLWPVLFVISLASAIAYQRSRQHELSAQFVVTGCFLVVLYLICFISGICTILNFLWRWVL